MQKKKVLDKSTLPIPKARSAVKEITKRGSHFELDTLGLQMTNRANNMENNNITRPTSVTAISMFCWLFSFASGMVGLFSIVDLINGNILNVESFFLSPLLLTITGLGLSILYFITGTGLWRLKKWSRLVAISISCLMILINLVSFFISKTNSQSTELTIGVLHGLALISLFSTKVKLAFSPS